jgi:hypothetical protein
MTTLPIRPEAAAELTRWLARVYGWPVVDRPRCWACSALSLVTLAAGEVGCSDLPCQARRRPDGGVAA